MLSELRIVIICNFLKYNKLKNNFRIIGTACFLILAGLFTNINAQEAGLIKEIKITSKENFSELRNLIAQNFDFTNPNYEAGKVDGIIRFEVAQNGKLENVKVESNNQNINTDLKDLINSLHITMKDGTDKNQIYSMPVSVMIASN